MANSLKIYKTQLTPARNALLEDIEGYLAAIENKPAYYEGDDELTYSSNDFQYIKPDLDVSIKIDVSRDNNDVYNSIGNYVRIEQYQGQEEEVQPEKRIWYYFIIGSKWTAQRTLQLQLSLDTINTFGDYLKDTDNWSDKTDIIRQHMPQYDLEYLGGNNKRLIEKIDKAGENIVVPYYNKTEDTNIEEPNTSGTKEWYLVYATQNSALSGDSSTLPSENPLNCYLYPKTSLNLSEVNTGSADPFTKSSGDWQQNKVYGIVDQNAAINYSGLQIRFLQKAEADERDPEASGFILIDAANTERLFNYNDFVYLTNVGAKVGDTITFKNSVYTCKAIEWYSVNLVNCSRAPFGYFENDNNEFLFATKINGGYFVYAWANGWTPDLRHWSIDYTKYALINVNSDAYESLEAGTFYDNAAGTLKYQFDLNYTIEKLLIINTATNATFTDTVNIYGADPTYYWGIKFAYKAPTELINYDVVYRNPSSGTTNEVLSCIDYINRTNSKLVKIIAIPYCPTKIDFTVSANGYNLTFDTDIIELEAEDSGWLVSGAPDGLKRLKYKNVYNDFGKYLNNLSFNVDWSNKLYEFLSTGELTYKSIENEPKLKHSDFTQNKLVYADVSNDIRLEDAKLDNTTDNEVKVNIWYQPTNTLSSDILYRFDIENGNYEQHNNWDKTFISNRNNEIPIYNNEYINYIKYAYDTEKANMDAMAKAERQANTINAITGIGTSTVGLVAGIATGNPIAGVGSALSLGSTIAKTFSNNTLLETRIANEQRSLQSKVDTLKNQAMNINSSGSSIDLLTKYTENRLHYMKYEMPERLRQLVWDKFYYTGYSHLNQEKPRFGGRLLFNFVQCNPAFVNEGNWVYNYYLADIKDKFNTGVTYYHKLDELLQDADPAELHYDFKQQFENWDFDLAHTNNYKVDITEAFSDNRYTTTIQLYINNPIFINTGFKYLLQAKRTADSAWTDWKQVDIKNINVIYLDNDGTEEFIPTAIRYKISGPVYEDANWTVITDALKPANDIYNAPTIAKDGIAFTLSSEYTIGQDAVYYQLRMTYNNAWQKYPYSTDTDYNNDYTTGYWFDIVDDLDRQAKVIGNCQAIYARIFNEATGKYSDWVAIEL